MTDHQLAAPEERLDDLLARARRAHPDRTAVQAGERRLTFADLDQAVDVAAARVTALLGGRCGHVVAVTNELAPQFAVACHAVVRSGNTVAIVNPFLRGPVLRHVLASSGADLVLAGPGVAPLVPEAAPGVRVVPLAEVALADGSLVDGSLADWSLAGEPTVAAGPVEDGGVACLLFTSGTTGLPKTVPLTHRNLLANARQVAAAHHLGERSVTVNHLPTYHPMHLNAALAAGATQVLCADPDPMAAVELARAAGATHLYGLPPRLAALAADPRLDAGRLPALEAVLSGGSALPAAAAAELSRRLGVPVVQGYGLAETSPLTHCEDWRSPRPGSVGRPVVGTECRVVDLRTRRPLPPGERGEVQVRGPQVMSGYRGSADGAPDGQGWLCTADVGYVDEQGALFLVDRLRDVFKCDDWLVSPSEVEAVLRGHPDVADAVVVGVPDAVHGHVVGAWLVPARGSGSARAAIEQVTAEVNGDLPEPLQVRAVRVLAAVPRSANGKIERRVLREAFLAPDEKVVPV